MVYPPGIEPKKLIKMNWTIIENKLVKTYHLGNTSETSDRIQAVNLIAGAHRHYPNFQVSDNKIKFELTSRNQNKISQRVYKMAGIIDQLFG